MLAKTQQILFWAIGAIFGALCRHVAEFQGETISIDMKKASCFVRLSSVSDGGTIFGLVLDKNGRNASRAGSLRWLAAAKHTLVRGSGRVWAILRPVLVPNLPIVKAFWQFFGVETGHHRLKPG